MTKIKNRTDKLYVKNNPKSPISESFRFLRTNLNYMNPDRDLKIIGVTSPSQAEGKSTVVANLGKALSLESNKVLIIDTDLRKPKLNRFFGILGDVGLSDYLSREIDYEYLEIIKKTGEENLDIITNNAIPPNPVELLNSKKMFKLLNKLRNDYDKIILDTAPIIPVSDTVNLAPNLDGVLIVVKANNTTEELLIKTKDVLTNVNANIIGVILNSYNAKADAQYYSKSYYY